MIPGLLAQDVAKSLREFIVTGFETDTWLFAGKFEKLVNTTNVIKMPEIWPHSLTIDTIHWPKRPNYGVKNTCLCQHNVAADYQHRVTPSTAWFLGGFQTGYQTVLFIMKCL